MKNSYATLLTGMALMMAGGLSAQSKSDMNARPALCSNSHLVAHGLLDARGTGPVNDLCSSVTPQALSVGGSVSFSGNNTGATITNDFEVGSVLEGLGFATVWHAVTTTACTNITVAYCGSAAGFKLNYWQIITTACPTGDASYILLSSKDTTSCTDNQATITYNALAPGTYYIPVLTDEANGVVGDYTINVSAQAGACPPLNNECAGAIPVAASTWCNPTTYTTFGATQTMAAITCAGFTGTANDDVWFSFVATQTDMTIGGQGTDDGDGDVNTGFDVVMELFSGACGSLVSQDCADSTLSGELEQIRATGLAVGQTYYVRVYDWYSGYQPIPTFGICLVEGGGIGIGVQEHDTKQAEWSIFPNPGTGTFNLQYAGANALGTIEVFDPTGRVVYSEKAQLAKGTSHAMDLSVLSAGNYSVRLTVGGVRTEQRLMVK